jgi:hypothetical protein
MDGQTLDRFLFLRIKYEWGYCQTPAYPKKTLQDGGTCFYQWYTCLPAILFIFIDYNYYCFYEAYRLYAHLFPYSFCIQDYLF